MSGFESPNYTQTPNDFFDMLPSMEETEVKVTLVMIRHTFGYHREGFKMGINKLADAAGLSRNGAKAGAERAEMRGTFKRTNPDSQGEAQWSLVVDPATIDQEGGQSVTTPPPLVDQQVGVKERIKKDLNKNIGASAKPKANSFPELVLFRKVTRRYPNEANWQDVIGSISKISKRLGRDASEDDLKEYYKTWTSKGYNPLNLAWLDWAVTGVIPKNGKQATDLDGIFADYARQHGFEYGN